MEFNWDIILTWEFWIVAATCGAIGLAIKAIPKVPSWIIPFVNGAISIILLCGIVGEFSWLYLAAGILAASVATYVYELFVQAIEAITGYKDVSDAKHAKE